MLQFHFWKKGVSVVIKKGRKLMATTAEYYITSYKPNTE